MPDSTTASTDASARAAALAARAEGLRRAQVEVQELTVREVGVMAKTAAQFFDTLPLVELTPSLMPHTVNRLHRIRHRIVQRTIEETETGMVIRALLLGKDGALRLFTARSADSRDLLQILEPGRVVPAGVTRDVVAWSPLLRVDGFRPFEILDRLSGSLDVVEEQLAAAEERVQVQKAALVSGNIKALMPPPVVVQQRIETLRAAIARAPALPMERAALPSRAASLTRDDREEAALRGLPMAAAAPRAAVDTPAVADEAEEWDEPAAPRGGRPPLGAVGNDRVVK